MKFRSILFTLLFIVGLASAQNEYSSSITKAVRCFETALKFYDSHQNEKALAALNEAIQADPKFVEAHTLQANIYYDIKEYEKSIASYKNAITVNPDFFANNYWL